MRVVNALDEDAIKVRKNKSSTTRKGVYGPNQFNTRVRPELSPFRGGVKFATARIEGDARCLFT